MKNEIGIGIIDVYSDEDLENCKNSIPEEYKDQIVVVSNRKGASDTDQIFTKHVPFATLRNTLLHNFRIKGYKYYFLINSNAKLLKTDVFEHAIQLAKTFGTWFITGPTSQNVISIEEDSANLTLELSPELNSDFLFLYSGIIKNFGFFDERFYNTKDFDLIDYINKMREKNVYPPKHYNPTIGKDYVAISSSEIQKINYRELPKVQSEYKPDDDRSMEMSCAYFYHKYKYVPTQNEPTGVTQEELFKVMEGLQKTYGEQK